MLTIHHGEILPLETEEQTSINSGHVVAPNTWPFGYMFQELQDDPKNLLPESKATAPALQRLGTYAMRDPGYANFGIPVPAIHTFLGQFIDHDITLELGSADMSLDNPAPLSPDQIKTQIFNSRSPNLDLDNVYGPNLAGDLSPRDSHNPNKMRIDAVAPGLGLPKGKDVWNDLPRLDDGTAMTGDPRDDENIITAQLHVAFLRAHNAIVDRGFRFDEARKLLIQHYQWIVLDDFLERITDPNIVKMIRYKGPRFFNPPARNFFIPLEFSIGAYRFGHSKVRPSYDGFNDVVGTGTLSQLFQFAGQSLPDNWIISWPSFLDAENPTRFPRRIDTSLSSPLLSLDDLQLGGHVTSQRNLAVRNLLRSYMLRIPTGQAVARAMASQGISPMTDEQIKSVAMDIPNQLEVLEDIREKTEIDLCNNTPLWFYILAEAAFYNFGYHLGSVGSTIVAEVLIGVLRNSTYSILADPQWRPTLGDTPGKFDIEDLLKLAGVFS